MSLHHVDLTEGAMKRKGMEGRGEGVRIKDGERRGGEDKRN